MRTGAHTHGHWRAEWRRSRTAPSHTPAARLQWDGPPVPVEDVGGTHTGMGGTDMKGVHLIDHRVPTGESIVFVPNEDEVWRITYGVLRIAYRISKA